MEIEVKDGSRLSADAMKELRKHADMIECECPHRLLNLLEEVREFKDYTENCIEKYPEDQATHRWLKSSAMNIDQLLSTTLIQLARLEGFIDDNNEIVDRDADN